MSDLTSEFLRQAIRDVMSYQWSNSSPAMHALKCLIEEAEIAAFELDRFSAIQEASRKE